MLGAMLGSAFSGLGGLIGSGLSLYGQQQQNKQAERLTREQWKRDDNAVQRRVADLKAAGMSPVLAAGQGASSSPAVRAGSEGYQNAGNQLMGAMSSIGQMMNTQAQSTAQTELIRNQAKKVELESTAQSISNSYMVGDHKRAKELHKKSIETMDANMKSREVQNRYTEGAIKTQKYNEQFREEMEKFKNQLPKTGNPVADALIQGAYGFMINSANNLTSQPSLIFN